MTTPGVHIIQNKDVLYPLYQARISEGDFTWKDSAWSATLGAIGGAGMVLLVALLVLLLRKPRRREHPTLAPMNIAQNVSTLS